MNKIVTGLLIALAVIFAMIGAWSIGESDFTFIFITCGVVVAAFFMAHPTIATAIVVSIYYSGLTAPGLPGKLSIFYFAAAVLCMLFLLQAAFKLVPLFDFHAYQFPALLFLVAIVITISARGIGFQALGSDKVGGMFYVQHFISLMLFYILPIMNLPAAWWPRVFVAMALCALLPAFSEVAIMASGKMAWLWMFIRGDSTIVGEFLPAQMTISTIRFRSAGPAGVQLLVALLAVVPTERFFRGSVVRYWALAGLCATIMLLGGYRSRIIIFTLIFLAVCYLQRTLTFHRIALFVGAFVVAWVVLIATAPILPEGIQRAVSAIPGVSVRGEVAEEAIGTLDWRLVLWRYGLHEIPDYLWLGKGLAYHGDAVINPYGPNVYQQSLAWAIESVSYHNGPLSVLIAFGLLGFIATMLIFWCIVKRHLPRARGTWRNNALQRCYQAALAVILVQIVFFFTIYGDAQQSFADLFFYWGILEALLAADALSPVAPFASYVEVSEESTYTGSA